MNSKPVLVGIATFKSNNLLFECLESLSKQTLSQDLFDIVIVLNGPRYPYEALIDSFLEKIESKHITLNYITETGLAEARNYTLDYAKKKDYQYITFVDDDDLVSESFLEELCELCEQESDMAVCNTLYFKDDIKQPYNEYLSHAFKKGLGSNLFQNRKFFSSGCTKMWPLEVIGNARFPLIRVNEDSVFLTIISKNIKNIQLTSPQAIYFIREREGSLSRERKSKKELFIHHNRLIFKYYVKYLFNPRYNFTFVLSRIVAQVLHIIRD